MTKSRTLADSGTAFTSVSATELGYVDGVTSAIQTQIDTKAPSSTAVTLTGTQTLTNKTLTAPIISTISNTGTLTLPTSTDTLVGKATTDTLTNKTLTSPALTTPTISTATTNGDLLYGTGSGALTRLGIGSSAQVLTVTGGVPSWATPSSGSMTSIASGSMSGSVLTLSSISASYTDLYLDLYNWYGTNAGNDMVMTVNNTTGIYGGGSAGQISAQVMTSTNMQVTTGTNNGGANFLRLTIQNYAGSQYKTCLMSGIWQNYPTTSQRAISGGGYCMGINLSSALNRIDVSFSAGTWANGTYILWGVK